MRLPRFSLLQLFLATALAGLLCGWLVQSWRAGERVSIKVAEISADGKQVAVAYLWGNIELWDVSGRAPKLAARRQPSPGFFHSMRVATAGYHPPGLCAGLRRRTPALDRRSPCAAAVASTRFARGDLRSRGSARSETCAELAEDLRRTRG
jgi:hypothetical protein